MQSAPEPNGTPPVSALVLVLAQCDGVAARLIADHQRDSRGYCRGCQLPQAGAQVWPCTLFTSATQAEKLRRPRR